MSLQTIVEHFLAFSDLATRQPNQDTLWRETAAHLKQLLYADEIKLTRCLDPLYDSDLVRQTVACPPGKAFSVVGTIRSSANLTIKDVGVISVVYHKPHQISENDVDLLRMVSGLAGSLDLRLVEQSRLQIGSDVANHILDAIGQGVTMVDSKAQFTYVNPAYANMLGLKQEALIGRSPRDFTIDLVSLEEAFELRLQGKRTSYESSLKHQDGTPLATYITGVPIYEKSDFSGSVSVITDITEHKKTEEAVRRRENMFRLLFDVSPIGIAICDNHGEFLRVNASFTKITGFADIKACFAQDVFRLEEGEDQLDQLINGEIESLQVEANCTFANGDDITLLLHGVNLDNNTVPVLFQIIDITEAKALEQRFRNSQKLDALSKLAGGIAHDFNNILAAISGYAEMLALSHGDADPQAKNDIEEIFSASARAAELTNKLLLFSRQRSFLPSLVDVNDSVLAAQVMFERLAKDAITVVTNLCDEPCLVQTDSDHFQQVILNLLINAREAMPDGGEITIWTNVNEKPDGSKIISLGVKDVGIGMDEETQEQIFEPFFTTKTTGTGLGLATVHGIVNQSNGTIEVVSAPREGSTFLIQISQTANLVQPAIISAGTTPSLQGRTRTILLVEDQTELRDIAKRMLNQSGFDVIEAANGPEAINCFTEANHRQQYIDLLFTDILMPGGINGWALAQKLQLLQPNLQVLYTSGFTADAIPDSVNPENFIMKPYRPSRVVQMINQMWVTADSDKK
jgi:two-component system cell cycle sensor histidine kinase/response regulator CckA